MPIGTEDFVRRASRKAGRMINLGGAVGKVMTKQGPTAAAHYLREKRAFARSQWEDVHENLVLRLDHIWREKRLPMSQLLRLISSEKVCDGSFEDIQLHDEEIQAICSRLDMGQILDVYQYFCYFGDFRTCLLFRDQALLAAVRDQDQRRIVSQHGVNAALELGLWDKAEEYLTRKWYFSLPGSYVRDAKALLLARKGKKEEAQGLWAEDFDENDSKFLRFLSNKSVAVVGPAPPDEEIGAVIDNFDVVVRTNFRIGSNEPTSLYGTRTDVSYYNHYRMSAKQDDVKKSTPSLPWVILKSEADRSRYLQLVPEFQGDTRRTFLVHPLFFHNAAPMAIPTILNDILRFQPKTVKIFCTNFYMSNRTYNAKYRDIPLNNQSIADSLRIHEPFSGFRFVQNMYKSGLCELDALTGSVIGRETMNYADGINALYGSCILPTKASTLLQEGRA